jgi:hypothetical protein
VQSEVAEVEARLSQYPELGVTSIVLEAHTSLYIGFNKRERGTMTAGLPSGLLLSGGQEVVRQYEVPDLGAAPVLRQLVLLLDLTNFDGDPPTAELLRDDRSPLPPGEWPMLGGGGIVADHPHFKRPFFCRRGLREFHTHPQHEDEPWDRYREGFSLHALVAELLGDLAHRWVGRR